MMDDGQGGLKPGKPEEVKVVQRLFDQYANRGKTLNSLTADLNARKIPSPTGGIWSVRTVRLILARPAYAGHFRYNGHAGGTGKFFGIDSTGEVVEREELKGPGKVYVTENRYEPIIDRKLFAKVQRRLEARATDRRLRHARHTLAGLMFCGHCGARLHGIGDGNKPVHYRCSAHPGTGCGNRRAREDAILPGLIELVGQEILRLSEDVSISPPPELTQGAKDRQQERQRREKDLARLAKEIDRASTNLALAPDERTFKMIADKVKTLLDERDRLQEALSSDEVEKEHSEKDRQALLNWWKEATNITAQGHVHLQRMRSLR